MTQRGSSIDHFRGETAALWFPPIGHPFVSLLQVRELSGLSARLQVLHMTTPRPESHLAYNSRGQKLSPARPHISSSTAPESNSTVPVYI